jgi:hypothetical protein
MRAKTGHIVFPKRTKYRDLVPIYKDLYMSFLEETEQVHEEDEVNNMMVRLNLLDLEKNRKPEGHNRNCRTKMVFPIVDNYIQFYISGSARSSEVTRVTEKMSKILKHEGIKHKVEWDQLKFNER